MNSKNLVKGVWKADSMQVIEKEVKIKLEKCPNHPLRHAILKI
jgi:hypothetical protein